MNGSEAEAGNEGENETKFDRETGFCWKKIASRFNNNVKECEGLDKLSNVSLCVVVILILVNHGKWQMACARIHMWSRFPSPAGLFIHDHSERLCNN
jgi:hypothetical protein